MEREDQKKVLKWMLGQVYRAENHKKQLEKRLSRIKRESEAPIGSPGYEPLQRAAGGERSGAASILFKLADIEEMVCEQKAEIGRRYVRVMDIIGYIPQGEVARQIFELRHLDGLSFSDVADAIPMSRAQCYVHYNKAMDRLLGFRKIQKMVEENEEEYIAWRVNCERLKKTKRGVKPENKTGNSPWKKKRKK
ncbi:MAG: hypothetical protein IJS41_03880 [Clostridia bacterium]|nr:hypothetical protein [Clostridia bacterium]